MNIIHIETFTLVHPVSFQESFSWPWIQLLGIFLWILWGNSCLVSCCTH